MKISVIVPTYNRRHYLSKCIESVMNQTFRDFELLIVDDHSTDGTYSLIKESIAKYGDRIKYFENNQAKGVSGARNTGLMQSQGEYVAFLDSDDMWDKNNLNMKIEAFMENPSMDGILSDSSFFENVESGYMQSSYTKEIFQDKFWHVLNNKLRIAHSSIVPFMLEKGSPFRIQSLILKKELLANVGFFNEDMKYYEDADFIIKCLCVGKVGYINEKLCLIRRHALNTDNAIDNNVEAEADMAVVKNVVDYAIKVNAAVDVKSLKIALRNAFIRRATSYVHYGRIGEARKKLFESIRTKMCIKAVIRLVGLYAVSVFPMKYVMSAITRRGKQLIEK